MAETINIRTSKEAVQLQKDWHKSQHSVRKFFKKHPSQEAETTARLHYPKQGGLKK